MAEARRAVHPLPSLKLEQPIDPSYHHFQAKTSNQGVAVFIPHPKYIGRNVYRFARRMILKVEQAFMPFPWQGILAFMGGVVGYVVTRPSSSVLRSGRFATLLWNVDSRMPFANTFSTNYRVGYLAFNTSVCVMVAFTFAHRVFLRALLSYTKWMEDGRGRKPLRTVVWAALLKYIYTRGRQVSTLAYQTSLPALPVPDVKDTVERYMKSMKPILDDEEYAQLDGLAKDFINKEGPQLQRYLKLKRLTSANYVSDWWLDYVYLRGRDSIMINSNFYGLSVDRKPFTDNQASRAAYVIHSYMRLRHEVEHEKLPVTMLQGMVPICMDQYTRFFSLTRIPGRETDTLRKYDWSDSRHIVIFHRGRYFKLRAYSPGSGKLLSAKQLEAAIDGILADDTPATESEKKLASLTAWDRTKWAEVREEYFLMNPTNRTALDLIESAVLFFSLDDYDASFDDLTTQGCNHMHGSGADRWFDKSISICVSKNGYLGMNGEHAFADAPTHGHLLDCFLAREVNEQPYGEDGRVKPLPKESTDVFNSERIHFQITVDLAQKIDTAFASAQKQIADLDLQVNRFTKFGKGLVKKAKCSPDAFVQMALQLAFFRSQGKFVQTYESAMTRLYRNGRTETIRSCSDDSCAFVKAVEAGEAKEKCVELLRKACQTHVKTSSMAMMGKGVDRHLFALYVVSVGTNIESPFVKAAMGRGWKLSTSQVPQRQSVDWKIKDDGEQYPRPSGGFGPVADDGFGVSYVISGENAFYFHVSSKKACPTTSSTAMTKEIFRALTDMAAICDLATN